MVALGFTVLCRNLNLNQYALYLLCVNAVTWSLRSLFQFLYRFRLSSLVFHFTTSHCRKIPPDYKVLFLQGGGTGQFAAVPLNLLPRKKRELGYCSEDMDTACLHQALTLAGALHSYS